MKVYKLKYHCEKCNKDFYINLHSGYKLKQEDLERFTNEIKQKHNKKEHTYCTRCKKKIFEGRGYPRIVGRKEPTIKEHQKGIDSILLFGIFCEKCNKFLDEAEKTNQF